MVLEGVLAACQLFSGRACASDGSHYKYICNWRNGESGKGDKPPPEHKAVNFLFLLYLSIASADIGDLSFPGCLKLIFSSLVSRLFRPFHHIFPAVHSRGRRESLSQLTKDGLQSLLFWAASYHRLSSFSKSVLLAAAETLLSPTPHLLHTHDPEILLLFTCSERRQLLNFP